MYIDFIVGYDFRWIDWNLGKIDKHGLTVDEVEHVVNHARKPFPLDKAGKLFVAGPTPSGLWIQVVFVLDEAEDELGDIAFVIHARPLEENDRRRYQRMIRNGRRKP